MTEDHQTRLQAVEEDLGSLKTDVAAIGSRMTGVEASLGEIKAWLVSEQKNRKPEYATIFAGMAIVGGALVWMLQSSIEPLATTLEEAAKERADLNQIVLEQAIQSAEERGKAAIQTTWDSKWLEFIELQTDRLREAEVSQAYVNGKQDARIASVERWAAEIDNQGSRVWNRAVPVQASEE
ncbi:MAG: hypothetical protein AAFX93_19660 [Verrucomicrobiota bacterium]